MQVNGIWTWTRLLQYHYHYYYYYYRRVQDRYRASWTVPTSTLISTSIPTLNLDTSSTSHHGSRPDHLPRLEHPHGNSRGQPTGDTESHLAVWHNGAPGLQRRDRRGRPREELDAQRVDIDDLAESSRFSPRRGQPDELGAPLRRGAVVRSTGRGELLARGGGQIHRSRTWARERGRLATLSCPGASGAVELFDVSGFLSRAAEQVATSPHVALVGSITASFP